MNRLPPDACLLFDLDGVVVDTEPQYDIFWKGTADKYRLGINNFEKRIKGLTLPTIISTYFAHLPTEEQERIRKENEAFDRQMTLTPIAGVLDFIRELKNNATRIGLVTSSCREKADRALRELHLEDAFDSIVTSERITRGKPDPMCYLLAAEDLGTPPESCIVFEDSIAGIEAATAAGMSVVALSTTCPESALQDRAFIVIPDFIDLLPE
jgi:HAD superfamily hydrolase (TIGR01509 family)